MKRLLINISSKDKLEKDYETINIKMKEIRLLHFLKMVENKESFILLFGGAWCRNCKAIVPVLNEFLIKNNLSVYELDPREGMKKRRGSDIRKSDTKDKIRKYTKISNIFNFDSLEESSNGLKKISVPFIVKIKDGKAISYYSKEYLKKDITKEVKEEILKDLEVLL